MVKILVVDDSATIRKIASAWLTQAGYEVIEANSPILFPLTLAQEKPDLVLLDVSMPLINGDSSLRKLKREAYENVIFLLHSSKSEGELQQLTQDCGANGYIQKSNNPDDLVKAVKRWLVQRPVAAEA